MKLYTKDKVLNVFFIREEHLALLNAKSIPLQDLPYLLYYTVALKDLVDWISFQRGKEKELFGKAFTQYEVTPKISLADRSHTVDLAFINSTLSTAYKEVKYYGSYNFYLTKVCNDTLVILCKDTAYIDEGFTMGYPSVHKTLYDALISSLGYHQLYFDETAASPPVQGIALPEVIAKLV